MTDSPPPAPTIPGQQVAGKPWVILFILCTLLRWFPLWLGWLGVAIHFVGLRRAGWIIYRKIACPADDWLIRIGRIPYWYHRVTGRPLPMPRSTP